MTNGVVGFGCAIESSPNGYVVVPLGPANKIDQVCISGKSCRNGGIFGQFVEQELARADIVVARVSTSKSNADNVGQSSYCLGRSTGTRTFESIVPAVTQGLLSAVAAFVVAWVVFRRAKRLDDERAVSAWLKDMEEGLSKYMTSAEGDLAIGNVGGLSLRALEIIERTKLALALEVLETKKAWSTLDMKQKKAKLNALSLSFRQKAKEFNKFWRL